MPNRQAKALRRTMTDAERKLWSVLRARQLHGMKFRRQHPCGPYILDFACLERRLAVEVDGGQHADSEADRQRTAWLAGQGWRVLRFWNHDVLANTDGVCTTILSEAEKGQPSPSRR